MEGYGFTDEDFKGTGKCTMLRDNVIAFWS